MTSRAGLCIGCAGTGFALEITAEEGCEGLMGVERILTSQPAKPVWRYLKPWQEVIAG